MAINEMALQRWIETVKKRLERHGALLRRHRERDRKILAVIKQLLEISKGMIGVIPTDKELSARRAAREKLGKAERPVYDLMFTRSNQEIADQLHLSIHTVKNHVKAIRMKLGITRGRTERHIQRKQYMTVKERLQQAMSTRSGGRRLQPEIAEEWADKIGASVKQTKAALVELISEHSVRAVDTRTGRMYGLVKL
jgi:DNA-binding CsgD family transcriptional regulator